MGLKYGEKRGWKRVSIKRVFCSIWREEKGLLETIGGGLIGRRDNRKCLEEGEI